MNRALVLCLTLTFLLAATLDAQDEPVKAEPALVLEAIAITPETPGVDTLCELRIRLGNNAEREISSLEVGVSVNGTALPVYEKQLFFDRLPPGRTTEVRLFNFWTTETSRPAPADGKVRLEVILTGAQWVDITTEDDGTEVWTLGENIPGLPVKREIVVPLAK